MVLIVIVENSIIVRLSCVFVNELLIKMLNYHKKSG
jgi:hypothetical protein